MSGLVAAAPGALVRLELVEPFLDFLDGGSDDLAELVPRYVGQETDLAESVHRGLVGGRFAHEAGPL